MPNLFAEAMASYTYGENTKENKPLAQVAPLSSRIALKYDDQKIFLKCELYASAKQTRSDEGYGNAIGKDFKLLIFSSHFFIIILNLIS